MASMLAVFAGCRRISLKGKTGAVLQIAEFARRWPVVPCGLTYLFVKTPLEGTFWLGHYARVLSNDADSTKVPLRAKIHELFAGVRGGRAPGSFVPADGTMGGGAPGSSMGMGGMGSPGGISSPGGMGPGGMGAMGGGAAGGFDGRGMGRAGGMGGLGMGGGMMGGGGMAGSGGGARMGGARGNPQESLVGGGMEAVAAGGVDGQPAFGGGSSGGFGAGPVGREMFKFFGKVGRIVARARKGRFSVATTN